MSPWVAAVALVALTGFGVPSTALAQTFTITTTALGGTITPPGPVVVPSGGEQAFDIAPDGCHTLVDVLVDGVSVGAVSTYTFTNVQADHKLEATFAVIHFTIDAMDGSGGSIDPSGAVDVTCGDDVAFTVTPNDCYSIQDVLVDDASVGAVSTYTFTNIQANHTIATVFSFNDYTITSSAGPNGSISPLGTIHVACGEIQEFAITPAPCYSVEDVLVDGASVGSVEYYAFNNVHANHTISATFVRDFNIFSSATGGGTISPTPSVHVICGDNQDFTLTADDCHHVEDVLVDGVSVGPVTVYTFTNVQANHTISASFAADVFTIAASAGAGGSITPSGDVPVNCGTDQAFSIAADACHTLSDVLVDGGSVGTLTTYTFTNVREPHTLAASFTLKTYSIAASAGTNGTISPSGSSTIDCGTDQAYAFTPAACYHVADVVVDAASVGSPATYTFTNVQADHTIDVSFALDVFTLAASAGAGGSITPSGDVAVNCGADQEFAIAADPCYHIADVLVDGSTAGAVPTYTFTNVQANHTIAASFAVDTYTIAATAGTGGSISPSGNVSVDCGSNQAFAIAPAACYEIADVMVDGSTIGAAAVYTFTNVQAGHTIDATFALNSYTITASADLNGSITPSGDVAVSCGADQPFAIAAATCYHVADVLVDGSSVGAVTAYTFTNVQANHTIAASFAIDTYTITASAGAGGSISPSGDVTVSCGADQVFTITAGACSSIEDVLVDGGMVGGVSEYTFTNVTANHTIAVSFVSTSQPTATDLQISPSPSVCQQALSATATVTPGTATGSIEFFSGTTSLGTLPLTNGQVALSLPTGLPVGGYSFHAVYVPTGCFLTSTSADVAHTVDLAGTSVALASDVNPSTWGQSVTFTATVAPSTATGSVTFMDGATTLGSASITNGVAQLSKDDLSPGSHPTITAVYTGDGCYATSTSPDLSQTVNRVPTTVSVTSDVDPSTYGDMVVFTATVAPAGGGNRVTFFDGSTSLGTGIVNTTTGQTTFSTSALLPGSHGMTVSYEGDSHYAPSSSLSPYVQFVNKLPTSVALTSNINPSQSGQLVKLTATLTPSDAPGTMEFFDGVTSLGTAAVAAGIAELSTSALAAGTHSLTASYGGDALHAISTSPVYSQVVNANQPPAVTVVYPNGAEDVTVGDDMTLQWTATDDGSVASVTLEVSRDNGATWTTITTDAGTSGSYLWTVVAPGTNVGASHRFTALLRVTARDNEGVDGSDVSDAGFSIVDPQTAVIVTELDAEPIEGGVRLKWQIGDPAMFTKLELQRSPAEVGPWATIGVELRDEAGLKVAEDQSVPAGETYFYRLLGTTSSGAQATFGQVKATAGTPKAFALSAAWPNPTRGPLTMVFSMASPAPVRLSVLDVQGREVVLLTSGVYRAGRFQVQWDGRTDRGGAVPPGLYFARLNTAGQSFIHRIVINP